MDDEEVDIESDFDCRKPLRSDLEAAYDDSDLPSKNVQLQPEFCEHPWILEQGWSLEHCMDERSKAAIEKMLLEEQQSVDGKLYQASDSSLIADCSDGSQGVGRLDTPSIRASASVTMGKNWSNSEKQLFEAGLEMYGNKWTKIAELVATKSVQQTKHYGRQYLKAKLSLSAIDASTTGKQPKMSEMISPDSLSTSIETVTTAMPTIHLPSTGMGRRTKKSDNVSIKNKRARDRTDSKQAAVGGRAKSRDPPVTALDATEVVHIRREESNSEPEEDIDVDIMDSDDDADMATRSIYQRLVTDSLVINASPSVTLLDSPPAVHEKDPGAVQQSLDGASNMNMVVASGLKDRSCEDKVDLSCHHVMPCALASSSSHLPASAAVVTVADSELEPPGSGCLSQCIPGAASHCLCSAAQVFLNSASADCGQCAVCVADTSRDHIGLEHGIPVTNSAHLHRNEEFSGRFDSSVNDGQQMHSPIYMDKVRLPCLELSAGVGQVCVVNSLETNNSISDQLNADSQLSPPDQLNADSQLSPPDQLNADSQLSPPDQLNTDSQLSPPDQLNTDSQLSPPDQLNTDSQLSPPDQLNTDSQLSPPDQLNTDSQLSPPDQLNTDSQLSPPDRLNTDSQLSPPDQLNADSSLSPACSLNTDSRSSPIDTHNAPSDLCLSPAGEDDRSSDSSGTQQDWGDPQPGGSLQIDKHQNEFAVFTSIGELVYLPIPTAALMMNRTQISQQEMQVHSEFFDGRPGMKNADRYLRIRNYMLDCWERSKPSYLNKTSVRPGLKNCGDVNAIGRIHAYLEQIGAINFDCAQCQYNSPQRSTIPKPPREIRSKDARQRPKAAARQEPMISRKRRVRDRFGDWVDEQDIEGSTIEHKENEIQQHKATKKKVQYDPFKLLPCLTFTNEEPAPFSVVIESRALMIMDIHAHLSKTEVIGLIGGQYLREQGKLHVTQAEPCDSLSTGMQCEMDPVSQAMASEKLDRTNQSIVGWYHSHPMFEPNPSIRDLETQDKFQEWFGRGGSPFIGIIVNPYSKQSLSHQSEIRCLTLRKGNSIIPGSPGTPYQFPYTISQHLWDEAVVKEMTHALAQKYASYRNQVALLHEFPSTSSVNCLSKLLKSVEQYLPEELSAESNNNRFSKDIQQIFLESYGLENLD